MTYQEALSRIESINPTFCKPGTERVTALCHALGDPQNELRIVHITGTNGKGSVVAMLENILVRSGFRTGVFSSPAVLDFCEQIRVNGQPIAQNDLAALTEDLLPKVQEGENTPTSFEFLTALAYEHFKREKCDVVLVETGLGGKLDATNVFSHPVLSVITSVALDHTSFLGNTVREIASHKAGIIKENTPILFGGEDRDALDVIKQTAKGLCAPLYTVARDKLSVSRYSITEGTRFSYREREDMRLSLLGTYQPQNAAIVLDAVDILKSLGFFIPENAVREGLATTVWHARLELLSHDPLILYDGAHNPHGIRAAVDSIRAYFGERKVVFLSGVLKDKDYTEIVSMLGSVALTVHTVTPDSPRALDAATYAEAFRKQGITATPHPSFEDAALSAIASAKASDAPLVSLGSLYLYRDLRPFLLK